MAASVAVVPVATPFSNLQAMEGKQFDDVSRSLVPSLCLVLLSIWLV